MGRFAIDTKVLNDEQLYRYNRLERNRMYPELVQEYTDGSYRIRYGNPEINETIYATLLTNGELIDVNVCEPRASRKDS